MSERELTHTELAILADLADENPRTRHTRSTLEQWKRLSPSLIDDGFIHKGTRDDARAGRAHTITDAGRSELARLAQKGGESK